MHVVRLVVMMVWRGGGGPCLQKCQPVKYIAIAQKVAVSLGEALISTVSVSNVRILD